VKIFLWQFGGGRWALNGGMVRKWMKNTKNISGYEPIHELVEAI